MSQFKPDLLLVNGVVVTGSGRKKANIAVSNGKISGIFEPWWEPPADRVIDLKGRYLLPGIVDPEGHPGCYVRFDRDIETESRAVAATGTTTWGIQGPSPRLGKEPFKEVISPEDVVSFLDVFEDAQRIVNSKSMVDTFFTFMMETDQQMAEIPRYAKELGVTSYKLYLHCKRLDLDRFWASRRAGLATGFDDGAVFVAMENTKRIGPPGIVCIHPENWEIARIFEDRLIAQGRKDWAAWSDRSPDFCEAHHVRTYAYLAKITGCPLYIQHATTEKTFEEILRAKGEGVKIFAQTGPAWLFFDKDNGWRINVPLRDEETRLKIWEALADGIIDCVGSDHVIAWDPNSREDLYRESIWDLRTGFTSRGEMLAPVMLSEGVNKGRITLERMVEVCCENPAKIFGLWPKKGSISVGSDADFVVVDLDKEVKVTKEVVFSRSGWSLLEGYTMKGWPVMTILRGHVLMEWPDGERAPRVGHDRVGRYLPRKPGCNLYPLD